LKKNETSDSKKGRQGDVTSPTGSSQVTVNQLNFLQLEVELMAMVLFVFRQGQRSQLGSSPLSGLQGQNAAASSLLQKLISEAESRGVVFSEDLTAPPPQQSLHGLAQSSLDDVIHQKWLSKLNLPAANCSRVL